jgi:hypothetical protein
MLPLAPVAKITAMAIAAAGLRQEGGLFQVL